MFSPLWFNLLICIAFLVCLGIMMFDAWQDSADMDSDLPEFDLLDSVGSEEK